jgi:fatty-acyl-CoA synthase
MRRHHDLKESGLQNAVEGVGGSAGKRALRAWTRALERSAAAARRPEATLAVLVQEQAVSTPDAPALIDDAVRWSYRELAERANRASRWALLRGVRPGDVVCLLMHNCAEYIAFWLGVTRVGGVVALLNTNLDGAALLHCVRAAAPRHAVAGAGFETRLAALAAELGPDIACWRHGEDTALDTLDGAALRADEDRPVTLRDTALLIYTSGTTGLPKAARISHRRIVAWAHWFAGMMNVSPADRMYGCLPLYHSVGGVVAVGALLVSGGSVAIRRGFSASRFWDEVTAFDCTLFQYIGELCRYLLNTPPHPLERVHRLRLACGNGLRGEVWERFKDRFAIPAILEFYAATEGNVTLYNAEGRPGAIGRVPGFLAHRFGLALVRMNEAGTEPLRNAEGRCVACEADESGEAIGRIHDGNFEGYTDASASERKVLHDVFEPGDAWFRTGDLMRKDAGGFYYFVDRLGDTFRWKGENVSTSEVAGVIAACPGVTDAIVFGVEVPGADGRAGMAAIAPGDGFDLSALRAHLVARLPDYARPRFVRLCEQLDVTGTFKLSKARFAADGYAQNGSNDPHYVDDIAAGAYVPIDAPMRTRIAAGMRL